ncbi:MAG TPA: amino acid--[acyl-carrier-protein] ligase [Rhodopila sp.]
MTDLRCDLVHAGLMIATGVDGVVGRGAIFEDVLLRVDAVITRWGQELGAETVHFPPVMNRRHLERNGYLKSFPQLASAVHGFTCNDHGVATAEDLPTNLMLVPAACYPLYPMVAARGPLPAGGALFDIQSWCFRREPSKDAPRLQSFRMHEQVRLGISDDVVAFRDASIVWAQSFFDSLQLPFRLDAANDAFFGRAGRLMASSQRERNLKVELLIAVTSEAAPTACCSFNCAEDHFTEAWGITMQDGSKAVSGCVGFGLERTTLALFRHHGLDPTRWPAGVRAVLFG